MCAFFSLMIAQPTGGGDAAPAGAVLGYDASS